MKLSENWKVSPSMAQVELRYVSEPDQAEQWQLTGPEDVSAFLRSIWNKDTFELREEFYVILLNNAKNVIGWCKTSMGGKTATIVDISQVVTIALLGNACSVVVAHNHPSGVLKPSQADINLTNRIATALKWHDLTLDDHLILVKQGFYSFRSHGKIKAKPIPK